MSNMPAEPCLSYETRLDSASADYARVDARWNLVANTRLVAFLAAVAAAAWGLWGRASAGWIVAGLLLSVFVLLALYHARLGKQRARLAALRTIQEEALARIDRRWDDLPMPWVPDVAPDHPYAGDLDIVGRASLFQLLDTTATRMGRETLARWLLAPSEPGAATARQGAVAELAPLLDLRQEIELRGRMASDVESDPETFLAWAEDAQALGDRGWLRWVAWLGPIAVVALGVADLSGVIPAPLWGVPLLVNLLVGATTARRAYATIAEVVNEQRALTAYAGQLGVLARADFADPALRHFQERLGTGERGAPAMLRRLGRLTGMAIPPSSILYAPIQALTLWDVHVLFALERWKRDGGHHARRWLETLGEAEALAALAGLRRDNLEWTFPSIEREGDIYRATLLGHPLLRDDSRVRNDVTIGPPGTFLLVTGSNMSGKSTLLRAVGVNAVLAQAGGRGLCRRAGAAPGRVVDERARAGLAGAGRLLLPGGAAAAKADRRRRDTGPGARWAARDVPPGRDPARDQHRGAECCGAAGDRLPGGPGSNRRCFDARPGAWRRPASSSVGDQRALHGHGRRGT